MKISVLIAAKTSTEQLALSLASVSAQVHGDWELIVVDCGSTGDTAAAVAPCRRHRRTPCSMRNSAPR